MIKTLFKKAFFLISILATLLVTLFLVNTSSQQPLETTDYVDPNRFTGEWYVISNIPYFAERNKVASKTTYMKIGDDEYQDIFEYKQGSFDNESNTVVGTAKCLNSANTKWQSTFFGIMTFKFEILEVDEDYEIMLIGHRSRDYGWVMARSSKIDDQEYQRAMQIFTDNGYDSSKFGKVPQHRSDIGQHGYQIVSNN